MTGYVYVIRMADTSFYKIGMSTDPRQRLSILQRTSPYSLKIYRKLLCRHPVFLERELHRVFKRYRKQYEWFDLTVDAIGLLDFLLEANGLNASAP